MAPKKKTATTTKKATKVAVSETEAEIQQQQTADVNEGTTVSNGGGDTKKETTTKKGGRKAAAPAATEVVVSSPPPPVETTKAASKKTGKKVPHNSPVEEGPSNEDGAVKEAPIAKGRKGKKGATTSKTNGSTAETVNVKEDEAVADEGNEAEAKIPETNGAEDVAKSRTTKRTKKQPESKDEKPEEPKQTRAKKNEKTQEATVEKVEKSATKGKKEVEVQKSGAPVVVAAVPRGGKRGRGKKEPSPEPETEEFMEEEPEVETEEPLVKASGRGQRAAKIAAAKKNAHQEEEAEEDDEAEPSVKKAKKGKPKKKPASKSNKKAEDGSTTTTNTSTTVWNNIDFVGVSAKTRITSWNVGGLRAWLRKGGHVLIDYDHPDILCLQEVKCKEAQIPKDEFETFGSANYHRFWCATPDRDGYAGVALLCKQQPINVTYGIQDDEQDLEGRCITAEFDGFYVICVYVPNAGRGLVTLPKRLRWNVAFDTYVRQLDARKPVVIVGDLNVAHTEIDLTNPKSNKKNAGFTPEERAGMTELLGAGFKDTFRQLNPYRTNAYTFWSFMNSARARNIGWRLDYCLVSDRLMEHVVDSIIQDKIMGSDHCPITLYLNV